MVVVVIVVVIIVIAVEKSCLPHRQDSLGGSHTSTSEDPRIEDSNGAESEGYADHVDVRCNDHEPYMSEPICMSSFVSVSDSRACDLHRLDRALLPRCDHLADTRIF